MANMRDLDIDRVLPEHLQMAHRIIEVIDQLKSIHGDLKVYSYDESLNVGQRVDIDHACNSIYRADSMLRRTLQGFLGRKPADTTE